MPVNVAGELWIGGPTVAAGYLGEEHSPQFLERDGLRWYRTGDRVVQREGGVLEFLGRLDEQLSIGGVRVEPAEIEQALTGWMVCAPRWSEVAMASSCRGSRPTGTQLR